MIAEWIKTESIKGKTHILTLFRLHMIVFEFTEIKFIGNVITKDREQNISHHITLTIVVISVF